MFRLFTFRTSWLLWLSVIFGITALVPTDSASGQSLKVDEEVTIKAAVPTDREAENWWRHRHQAKTKLKDSMEQVDLLFVGDSITQGWENPGKEIWQEYYGDRHALNLGFSGDLTEHVLWRLRNGEIEYISPRVAVVMIGTNNTGRRMEKAEHTAEGIRQVVKLLKGKLPETEILLLGIFPRDAKARSPKRKLNDEINEIISQFADEDRVHYLNINEEFLNEKGELSREVMPDLLHPNAKGYEIWARAMEPKLKELLGED